MSVFENRSTPSVSEQMDATRRVMQDIADIWGVAQSDITVTVRDGDVQVGINTYFECNRCGDSLIAEQKP